MAHPWSCKKNLEKNIDNFFQVPLSKVVVEFYGSLSLLSADDSLKTNVIFVKAESEACFCRRSSSIIWRTRLRLDFRLCVLSLAIAAVARSSLRKFKARKRVSLDFTSAMAMEHGNEIVFFLILSCNCIFLYLDTIFLFGMKIITRNIFPLGELFLSII